MDFYIGQIVTGKISGIRPYGAFVKFDHTNQQGLIHISECQHGYVSDINQVLSIGQPVKVKVLNIDEYTQKISLSLRALEPVNIDPTIVRKKHYWTNYHQQIGFQTIAKIKPQWLQEIESDMK